MLNAQPAYILAMVLLWAAPNLALPGTPTAEFYVDPDYVGASQDGSPGHPWSSLAAGQWSVINTNLAAGDVIVYFSAREASVDSGESYGIELELKRTDSSAHRLTVDGMSKYNADDINPDWRAYSGSAKMKLAGRYSIGLGSYNRQNNETMRGFEVSGPEARVTFGGDNVIVENIYSHDTQTIDPAFHMFYATSPEASCVETAGRYSNVIIRNNLIVRSYGEAIYVGGTNHCPGYGNSHSNITITGNTIRYSGVNGGQGDGIDLKDGLTNVTVRGNTIINTQSDSSGITAAGVYSGVQNLVIEGNLISGSFHSGIQVGNSWGAPNGVSIRNNIIIGNNSSGVNITGDAVDPAKNVNIEIANNTVYGNTSGGVSIGDSDGVRIFNNLIFGNNSGGAQIGSWAATNITSDFNLFSPQIGWSLEGAHSTIAADPAALVIAAAAGDFHLQAGSPALDAATGLASVTVDFEGNSRPQGSAPDIGAYEYVFGSAGRPAPPGKVRINQ